jgi:SprT protein
MVAPAVRKRVEQRVRELVSHATQRYSVDIAVPKIKYTLRGSAAGAAYLFHWAIDLNPCILVHHEHEFVTHTVGHEVAHLVTVAKYGDVAFPHGREWQGVMRDFELPPRITHNYSVPG